MGKKSHPPASTGQDKPSSAGVPFNFRIPREHLTELKRIGEAMGLDASAVARMILAENMAPYSERADAIEAKKRLRPQQHESE